jgi:Flp pilus assembly pilin Flp
MSKLLVSLALLVLLFGVAVYIFGSGSGVKDAVRDGHTSVTNAVRSFDYVTD